jgi:hypothetical protein
MSSKTKKAPLKHPNEPTTCGRCDNAVAVGDAPWGEERIRCTERDEVRAVKAEGCVLFKATKGS